MYNDDQAAVILLRTGLALPKGSPHAPFRLNEWEAKESGIGPALRRLKWREGTLLGMSAADIATKLGVPDEVAERVAALLARGGQLALERDRLQSRGMWLLTRYDDEYPAILLRHLDNSAPPVLFGAGAKHLLSSLGLGIVGSRDVDAEGLAFAETLARACATSGLTVCSGGARGVDITATRAALAAGGRAVSVLGEGIARSIRAKENVRPLLDGTLAITSPYLPDAGFTVGHAMGRNRIVYCLSRATVVVASAKGKGGTWAGATENLDHRWVPLYVRTAQGTPAGNDALIERGGQPVRDGEIMPLLARLGGEEGVAVPAGATDSREATTTVDGQPSTGKPASEDHRLVAAAVEPRRNLDMFVVNWPILAERLTHPKTEAELAAEIDNLDRKQLKQWLDQAVDQGLAGTKKARPKRYFLVAPDQATAAQAQLAFSL